MPKINPATLAGIRHSRTAKTSFGDLTVFHFEAPRSSDLGRVVEEAPLVQAACRLSDHRFVPFRPTNSNQFKESLRYVFGTWRAPQDAKRKPQFVLHLSCHGNDDGINIGGERLTWTELGSALNESVGTKDIPFVLTISACGGRTANNLSQMFNGIVHPVYIFSFGASVAWSHAALTWAILYNKIPELKVEDKDAMQDLVNTIHALSLGELRYHRWNGTKYLHFNPATQKDS